MTGVTRARMHRTDSTIAYARSHPEFTSADLAAVLGVEVWTAKAAIHDARRQLDGLPETIDWVPERNRFEYHGPYRESQSSRVWMNQRIETSIETHMAQLRSNLAAETVGSAEWYAVNLMLTSFDTTLRTVQAVRGMEEVVAA